MVPQASLKAPALAFPGCKVCVPEIHYSCNVSSSHGEQWLHHTEVVRGLGCSVKGGGWAQGRTGVFCAYNPRKNFAHTLATRIMHRERRGEGWWVVGGAQGEAQNAGVRGSSFGFQQFQ